MVFLASFAVLSVVCVALSYAQRRGSASTGGGKDAGAPGGLGDALAGPAAAAFQRFQAVYLVVFLLMMGMSMVVVLRLATVSTLSLSLSLSVLPLRAARVPA
jgi:hypothetical protein